MIPTLNDSPLGTNSIFDNTFLNIWDVFFLLQTFPVLIALSPHTGQDSPRVSYEPRTRYSDSESTASADAGWRRRSKD